MKTFKTKGGSELIISQIKGKDYLMVAQRIIWFREEHPDYTIETEIIKLAQDSCLSKAYIKDSSGRIISMSHKFEDAKGFPDFIEKSETGAIGRALALSGYGTQFCADDLDEGKRLADAPIESNNKQEVTFDNYDKQKAGINGNRNNNDI